MKGVGLLENQKSHTILLRCSALRRDLFDGTKCL